MHENHMYFNISPDLIMISATLWEWVFRPAALCSLKAPPLYDLYVTVQYNDIKVSLSAAPVSFSQDISLRSIERYRSSTATLLVSFFGVGLCVIIGSFSSGGGSAHLSWLLLSPGLSLAARDQWLWTLPLLYGQAKQPFLSLNEALPLSIHPFYPYKPSFSQCVSFSLSPSRVSSSIR